MVEGSEQRDRLLPSEIGAQRQNGSAHTRNIQIDEPNCRWYVGEVRTCCARQHQVGRKTPARKARCQVHHDPLGPAAFQRGDEQCQASAFDRRPGACRIATGIEGHCGFA